jgi:ubiquinone/menaquinone biosynthesis C-methylase UbiE
LAERIALRKLLPRGGQLCLEVGAGAGRLTDELQAFGRVVLLDYSRTQLQQAQARLGRSARFIYVAADVYQLPFVARQFDCVTMVRVLHHMADAPAALAGLAALLRPAAPLHRRPAAPTAAPRCPPRPPLPPRPLPPLPAWASSRSSSRPSSS